MDWYYVVNGQRQGPVSEEEFLSLVNAGMITSESLVWRQGMTQWRRYAEAVPARPANPFSEGMAGAGWPQRCVECGAVHPPDEMIHYGDNWVCAACKPVFFQRLREGSPLRGVLNYAGFWIRFGAKFVDGLIMWVVTMAVNLGLTGIVSLMGSSDGGGAVFMAVQGVLVMFMMLAQLGIGLWGTRPISSASMTPLPAR